MWCGRLLTSFASVCLLASGSLGEALIWAQDPVAKAPKTIGQIERLDPAFDHLVPGDATIEVLASGFEWSEGPVWVPRTRSLLFSDIPHNRIVSWNERDGISTFREPAGYTGSEKVHWR